MEGVGIGESVHAEYERAYGRYSKEVFRFALAWTNDWSAAEDLVQEAYLRLWKHRVAINWDRPVLAWLLTTVRHLAQNRFRSLRPWVPGTRVSSGIDESLSARWLDVRAAFTQLSPLERTALVLTAVEGWSYSEAAQVLQTSDGALRAAVSRARDKLEVA